MWHFFLPFIFLPWLWFRVKPCTGAVFWHCLFGKVKEKRKSEWCFSHAVSAFGTPGHVGLTWTEPLHNCCLLCRSEFLGDTLSAMHEVMDSCLILVAPSSRVPWCPSFASSRGVTAVICKSCHNYPRLSFFLPRWLAAPELPLQLCQQTSPMSLSPTQKCFLCSPRLAQILFQSSSEPWFGLTAQNLHFANYRSAQLVF